MRITRIAGIGAQRERCTHAVRVAVNPTNASLYAASERRRLGVPIDVCGKRGEFVVDGQPRCRPHAGQDAITYLLEKTA